MNKINLVLGIHNHQPVGNFDFVFEEAFQKAYLPFCQVLAKHPHIKLAQHYSGILFEWILEHHPEFLPLLKSLVQRGQVEMMTGGYYEPILMTIPDADKVGQIKKLTQFIKKQTGYQATGAWLAERVWEPQLPNSMAEAGIRYTVTDDSHFKYAGLRQEDLYGYYLTEDSGVPLNVFPISEKMRYLMPFRPVDETIEFLQSVATEDGKRLIVFADDGEKFGVWPGTFDQCYQYGWLDHFFTRLEQNLDWIRILTFSDALTKIKPCGRVYLPTASYREMMEWALPFKAIHQYEDFEEWLKTKEMPDKYQVFVKGGFWRNFLAKYHESNNLHKRMLWAAKKYQELVHQKNEKSLQKARDHIYAGQCNCPYWHGVFGGLYLPHLRSAIYANLIQADCEMDRKGKTPGELKSGWVHGTMTDFNVDGYDEVIVESDRMNVFFAPQAGGSIFELDYKPIHFNLLDTMTRYEEGYHRKLLRKDSTKQTKDGVASIHDIVHYKEEGLENYLTYDWYRRSSLLDHFLHQDVTLDTFRTARYHEQGDFVNQPYEVKQTMKNGACHVVLQRHGHVWVESRFASVFIQKTVIIEPHSNDLEIEYIVRNDDAGIVDLRFGTEFAFSLLAGNAPDRYYELGKKNLPDRNLASVGEIAAINMIHLVDEWLGIMISLETSLTATLWRFPIETVSMSEAGFERIYQCSVVMPNWNIRLDPKQEWQVHIRQQIKNIK